MTFPFVAVEWDDAWADHEVVSADEVMKKHKASRMETRGWLLGDTADGLSVFNERCLDAGDDSYRGRTFIPRAMVRSVNPVREPRKARTRAKPRSSETVPNRDVQRVDEPHRQEGR